MKINRLLYLVLFISINVNTIEISYAMHNRVGRSDQDRACYSLLDDNIHFFGLFDGHGEKGHIVAEYACTYFPKTLKDYLENFNGIQGAFKYAYEHVNDACNLEESGSTAITAIIDKDKLYIANAGDSKGVISINGVAVQITQDHKPNNYEESKRLEELKARFVDGYIVANNGLNSLGMSRSIWDKDFWPYVIPTPYINQPIDLNEACEFVMLASDGVWDVVSIDVAVKRVSDFLKKNDFDLQKAVKDLVDFAYRKYSAKFRCVDDITVTLICFDRKKRFAALNAKKAEEEQNKKCCGCIIS